MAFVSAPLLSEQVRAPRSRRRRWVCTTSRSTDDNGAIETPSRDLPPPPAPSVLLDGPQAVAGAAVAGGAIVVDFVSTLARTLTPQCDATDEQPSLDSIARASAAKIAAERARDLALQGAVDARDKLTELERELEQLVPDIGERERRLELARNGECVTNVDVDGLLDGARANVDGVVARTQAAKQLREEAEKNLKQRENEMRKLRAIVDGSEVDESVKGLEVAMQVLKQTEESVALKREELEIVESELNDARRVVSGLQADIAAVEVLLPGARVAADTAKEEVLRRDRESCRALDGLVDELEKATQESAAVLRLAEANLDQNVVKEIEAAKNVFAARIRRAETVLKSIVKAKQDRQLAVNEVLDVRE